MRGYFEAPRMRCSCAIQDAPSPCCRRREAMGTGGCSVARYVRYVFEAGVFTPDPSVVFQCFVARGPRIRGCARGGSALGWCRRKPALSLQCLAKRSDCLLRLPAGFQANADLRHGSECEGRILRGQRELLERFLVHAQFLERQTALVPFGGSWRGDTGGR